MLRIYALLLLCSGSQISFGQGSIAGTITDSKTKEAVIGASVIIQGTSTGAATDVEGKFLINNVPAGTVVLQVSSITYKPHVIQDVVVENAKRVTLDIQLTEDVSTLQEVVVTSGRSYDTDFEMLRSIKESKLVVVGITAEQINRTLDRDAAQVLRRVPGVTIKDNQFVQVRGLSERYNPVMLHNVYAPSVETDIRSFSFATLPSNQLDRMLIFKSPSADNPGDFAGGIVKVFTKGIPDENGIVVEYSTQVRAGTTFQDFYHQQRGGGFPTGFNTGYYDLPAGFPANASNVTGSDLENAGKSLKNLWTPVKGTAIPDQRFALTFNRKFEIGKVQVGNVSAITYSNAFATYSVQRGDYTDNNDPNKPPDPNFRYQDKQYNQLIRTGFLFNWAFRFSPAHSIEFKNLFNQSSADQYVDRAGTPNTISGGQKNAGFDKVYRGIYSGQLLGTHDLFQKRTTIEWVAGYNQSNRDQPDYKRYLSLDDGTGKKQINVPNTVTPTALGRFYSKLDEHAFSGGVSVRQRFGFTSDPLKSPELKAGLFFENKNRNFGARNIGYTQSTTSFDQSLTYLPVGDLFQPQNINNITGMQINEATNTKDSYTASNHLFAYYLMASVPFGKFKFDGGVRIENNLQQMHSYDNFIPGPVEAHLQVNRLLPSANLSFNFTEKMLVRAAYGQTLNRPEFRELAPFTFYDFNFNFLYSGNPTLKTAKIQNLDLRWEFYPSKGEMITFGGFYKKFDNPIESYVDINNPGGGNKLVTYANSQSATLYGLEFEVKKSLAGLLDSRLMKNINFLFNSAVTNSVVKVAPQYATGRTASRPLQGQAPYVINTGFFYTSDASGWQVNLLYNVLGKTVYLVGTDFYHDVYLMPRHVVDLTFSKRVGRFQIKGGVSDIFNQPWLYLQDGNNDKKLDTKTDQVIQKFKPGQVFSLGFSARL